MGIFSKKSIASLVAEANEQGEGTLKKTFGSWGLVALGVGAIIGAGLFSLTGIAAAENAGPAVALSFMIAALGCAFAGLCYAEFASMLPVAGSAYTYSYATMGEFIAWIIGWDLVLEYALASATVAVSWSQYFNELLKIFNLEIPEQFLKGPFEGGMINVPAIVIVCLLSLLLMRGTQESARLNNLLVILKVAVVIIFIALGWQFIDPANHDPFIPTNVGEEMVKSGE